MIPCTPCQIVFDASKLKKVSQFMDLQCVRKFNDSGDLVASYIAIYNCVYNDESVRLYVACA